MNALQDLITLRDTIETTIKQAQDLMFFEPIGPKLTELLAHASSMKGILGYMLNKKKIKQKAKKEKQVQESIAMEKPLIDSTTSNENKPGNNKIDVREMEIQFTPKMVEQLVQTEFDISSDENCFNLGKCEDDYDCKIEGNSLNQLCIKGWNFFEKRSASVESCIICMLGKCNSGKSFLLNYLLEEHVPNGFDIHTSGLSVVSPKNQFIPLTFIDFKCFERNLILDYNNMPNNKQNNHEKEVLNSAPDSFSNIAENILMDQKVYEQLLQTFILTEANLLLVTIHDINDEDQILIQMIRQDLFQRKSNKTIMVIHNFSKVKDKAQADEKVQQNILQIFNVKPLIIPYSIGENRNNIYYQDLKCRNIVHLVMAKERSPAGDYYNPTIKEFIMAHLKTNPARKDFNILERLKEFLEINLPKYLKFEGEAMGRITINQEGDASKKVLKLNNGFSFKKLHFNAFGEAIGYDEEARIAYDFVTTICHIELTIELPGMSQLEISAIKHKVITEENGYFLEIKGKKTKENIGEIRSTPFNQREFGKFVLKSPLLELKKYDILNPLTPERKQEDGILKYKWSLRPKNEQQDI